MKRVALSIVIAASLVACASAPPPKPQAEKPKPVPVAELPKGLDASRDRDPFPSTYRPLSSKLTAIVHASIFTGTGTELHDGTVVIDGGKIASVQAGGNA